MSPIQELSHTLKTTVGSDDLKRLKPHLGGWNHLNEILLLNQMSAEDIKKLILIEITNKEREQILSKLTARLKSLELKQLREHIRICLKRN